MTATSSFALGKKVCVLALFFLLGLSSLCLGQQLTGTLTGTTLDATGAVVANAKVEMKNEQSGDVRTTVSNGSGYFSITAVQPGSYTVSISAPGFKGWVQPGIVFAQGDHRTLPNISLQVGAVNETVEISANALTVPTDNGEISTTVPQHMIESFPMANRNAGDLLKIMPGMAFANGANQGATWSSGAGNQAVSSGNGPVGSFSSNGTQPSGAMAFMLDGANLVDPGNMGSQMANINQDMISEVKVLMSDYDAEYAKGPVLFEAYSKSGGTGYHGEGYLYAKNSALNSIDAYTHSQIASGATTAAQAAPESDFYYMGGNVGGPVPGLSKGNKKLFFFGGYEYMKQHPAGSITNFNVPTAEQLAGDFSNTTINGLPGSTTVSTPAGPSTLVQQLQSVWNYAYASMYAPPAGGSGTSVPQADFDPNGVAYAKLLPHANITPSQGNGWSNYQFVTSVPQNRWEGTGKLDYNIGDNTKLTGSYTQQKEQDQHPIGIWWTPPWTLPYPSNVLQNLTSNDIMTNFTHTFSPTTTNEAVFTYARFNAPNSLANPAAVDRSALGMSMTGFFGTTTKQIPNIQGPWGGMFPDIAEMNLDGPFEGGFGAEKKDWSIYDNFTRVIGKHTIKAGAYFDTDENIQSTSAFGSGANGNYNLGWGPQSTGNTVADFLIGHFANYQQPSADLVNTIQDHQWSIYAQDAFKVTRRLTVNYGLRLDHIGQWYGPSNGMAVWDPATYQNGTPANPITQPNTGLAWNSIDHRVPMSGWSSPLFYPEPRVSFAYDLKGNGRTVVRGGFAAFRYQVSVNDVGGATNLASGVYTPSANNITSYAAINSFAPPSSTGANGTAISAMKMGDNKTPHTYDWNFSVARELPWRSVFEISYVGNKSYDELINGANGKIDDINGIQPGTYYRQDPVRGLYTSPGALPCNNTANLNLNYANCAATGPNGQALSANYNAGFTQNDFRSLTNYTDIYLITHGSYANYNSLQMSWKKQAGSVSYLLNYTFSKVLGIRDGNTNQNGTNGALVDPFNLAANYGPLAYDHTNIVNGTVVWNLPSPIHSNRLLAGAVNGWQLSNYTTYQSGAPLQASNILSFNFPSGLTVPLAGDQNLPDNSIALPNGLRTNAVNAGAWYGTDQTGGGYAAMLPALSCDPRSNRAQGQYFNVSCFTIPAFGKLGSLNWPYIHAPAYFDSDLGLYKSFRVTESKSLQFRIQATNFLNHALPQFGLAGTSDETFNFTQNTQVQFPESGPLCGNLGLNPDKNNPSVCNYTIVGMSPVNTNKTMTGKPAFKTGSRVLTFSAKFTF